jgi:hypothetical protein
MSLIVIPAQSTRCAVPRIAQARPGGVADLADGIPGRDISALLHETPAFAGATV